MPCVFLSRPSSVLPCSSRHAYPAQAFPTLLITKAKYRNGKCIILTKKKDCNRGDDVCIFKVRGHIFAWKSLNFFILPWLPSGPDVGLAVRKWFVSCHFLQKSPLVVLLRKETCNYGLDVGLGVREWYEVATMSRLPKKIGLFCKRAL